MNRRTLLLAAAASAALPAVAPAAPTPTDPERRTPWDLYLTAREAAALKTALGDGALLVDVRDPIEIMFTGFAPMVDANVPFLLSNPAKWSEKKPVFAMEPNPGFVDGIDAALARRGLDRAAPVILMCRSGGERGAPSAKALAPHGFAKVYVVTDGFEGGTSKAQPGNPARNVDGWKNSGLPWGFELDRDKMFFRA